jgi:hypothetical protein
MSVFASREHKSSVYRQRVHKKLHTMYKSAKSPAERVIALAALGNIGDRHDFKQLQDALGDEDARVRAQAARSFRNIHGYDVNDLLVESLVHDPVDQVKSSALETLLDHRTAMPAKKWALICSKLHSTGTSSKIFAQMLQKRLSAKGINSEAVKNALVQVGTATKASTAVVATPCTTCQKCLDSDDKECRCHGYWSAGVWNPPQYDRVPLPDAEQFFDPVFYRTGSGEGNSHINFGDYAELQAEACRATGANSAWSAQVSVEAGKEVRCLGESYTILGLKLSGIKGTTSGWADIGPSIILLGFEIRMTEFDSDDRSAGSIQGGFNIHSCDGVTPFIFIPVPFGKSGPADDKQEAYDNSIGYNLAKTFKENLFSGPTRATNGGQTTNDRTGLDFTFTAGFRVSIIKIEISFSVSFALGLFVEPCSTQSDAAVAGLDPSLTAAVSVQGGIDLGVAAAGVGIELTLVELHLPAYVNFWTGTAEKALVCPTVHLSVEFQLVWYALAGKFYVYVTILFVTTYPFEYYFPQSDATNQGLSNNKNTGSWFLQGSYSILNWAWCTLGKNTDASLNECVLRSTAGYGFPNSRGLGTSGATLGMQLEIYTAWDDARDGTCYPNACGKYKAGPCTSETGDPTGQCFYKSPDGNQRLAWNDASGSPVVGCDCLDGSGHKGYKCSTKDTFGQIDVYLVGVSNIIDEDNGPFNGLSDPYVKTKASGTQEPAFGWTRTGIIDGVSSYNWNTDYSWYGADNPFQTKIYFDVQDDDDGSSENLGSGSISMSDLHTDIPTACPTQGRTYIQNSANGCTSSWQSDSAYLRQGTISYKYRWRPWWKEDDGPWSAHPDTVKYVNTEEAGVENPKGDYGISEGAETVPSLMGLISNKNQKFCRYASGSIVCDLAECSADPSCVFQTEAQEDNTMAIKSMSANKWCDTATSNSKASSKSRLVDSSGNPQAGNTGLLQMKLGSTWKYVCDDKFDANNNGANVACRELGYAGGSHSDGTTNSDSLFYDEVNCAGTEASLADCPHLSTSSAENCAANEGVTLTCTAQSDEIKCAADGAAEASKFITNVYLSEYAAEVLPTKAKYEGKAISIQALGGGFCYNSNPQENGNGKVLCNSNGDPHKQDTKFTVVVYDAEQGIMLKTADKTPAGVDEDCALEAIKGQVHYAFRNSAQHVGQKYCYKLTIGESIGQDVSSSETACNANGYSQDFLVGTFAEVTSPTEETFTNGDSCGSNGNRKAIVRVHQDPTTTTTQAVVVEDPICTYNVVITTPKCG